MHIYKNKLLLVIIAITLLTACVPNPNKAPIAVDDGPIEVVALANISIDILANDTDDNNAIDTGTITISKAPSLGTAVVQNGKIFYTAGNIAGEDSLKYSIKDKDKSVSNEATVTISVLNTAPKITSRPSFKAIVGIEYSYAITAQDSSPGEKLEITSPTKPDWLSLNDSADGTAILSGTPSKADVGNHRIVIRVYDSVKNIAEQAFTIAVLEQAAAVSFISQPILAVSTSNLYSYKITAVDSNTEAQIAITATTKPDWLSLSGTTNGSAVLSGTASDADIGSNDVILKASNSNNQFAEQTFAIEVSKEQLASLRISSVSITEGNSGTKKLSFSVSLNSPSDKLVSFDYASSDGTALAAKDYQASSGTASIPIGNTSTQIDIKILGDTEFEKDETFKLTLSKPINARLATSEAVGTILNDDKAVADIIPNPIVFVTQFPIQEDFTTITSTFGNHLASMQSAGRGGDLMIIYPDGSLKNLTKAAGYGVDGLQNAKAIAVRDPEVHWDAKKVIFSMVVGATNEQYVYQDYYWQIYEITGLSKDETPVISKLANQPQNYNNISPIYTSDDKIIFTSDRPRDGQRHLYPQLDEYEEAPTVSGLWKLDPNSGNLTLLDHAPSGAFSPIIDSFGRVIYTRWDHLQRDQQADTDAENGGACEYCAFNYSGEGINSVATASNAEVFPEPRHSRKDLLAGSPYTGHSFNHFFPWMLNQDGTEHETLNHIGRHELHDYFNKSRNDDPALQEGYVGNFSRYNDNAIENLFQISEQATKAGYYLGITAPEFGSHAAGQIVALLARPEMNADQIKVDYLTDPKTSSYKQKDNNNDLGLYREPLVLSDGTVLASYTTATHYAKNLGSRENPSSDYDFRLYILEKDGQYWQATKALTSGIKKEISFYDPDVLVNYNDDLWELSPVELVAKTRPSITKSNLPNIERNIFNELNINVNDFQNYLRNNNLALIVSRNITVRDDADKQQPFNLRVSGTDTVTKTADGKIYDVSYMQYFQGSLIRSLSYGNLSDPLQGRRVLAQELDNSFNGTSTGPIGSVSIASDGSIAAFVPVERALVWQLTDESGEGVVRERNWLSFQAGEIRVCAGCHGINDKSQAGKAEPQNSPLALKELLEKWKAR